MNKKSPLVSIVLPCYNSESLIPSCLKSILATKYKNIEIIAVDDGSSDNTLKKLFYLSKKNKNLKVFSNGTNKGPSYTRNFAMKKASGKYIAFLETDTEVDRYWLEPLVDSLERNVRLGAVQSMVLDINKKNIICSSGIYLDPHTFWVHSDNIGLDIKKFKGNHKKYILTGAVGSLFRKNIIKKMGGFDEKIVHNIDDLDFSFRVYLSGYKIALVPKSKIYNWTMKPSQIREKLTPGIISEFYSQKTFRIFLKNYEWIDVIKYTPWLFAINFSRIFTNLVKGNSAPLQGFIRAYIWNIQLLKDTLSERRRIQRLRKVSDAKIFDLIGLHGNVFDIYFNQIQPIVQRAKSEFN